MCRKTNCQIFVRCLQLFIIAVMLVMALHLISRNNAQATRSGEPSDLLAFTAAGHVLGFEAGGVYVAAGDHMLRVEFVDASGVAPVADRIPLENRRAQALKRVIYADLWPGITLSYERVAGGIFQSNYHLNPGTDVAQIRLCYNAPVEIEPGGSLRIKYETGRMRESAPIAWQYINSRRVPVDVTFGLLDSPKCKQAVGFTLGQYNPAYPLIIDPTLEWNTSMGSSGFDSGRAIAVDGNGNVYVAGDSDATWGSPQNPFAGEDDAFAAKLNSNGVLQWNTFLGSSDYDSGKGVAVDGSGNVYEAGTSRATWGSPVNLNSGAYWDAFAAKLAPQDPPGPSKGQALEPVAVVGRITFIGFILRYHVEQNLTAGFPDPVKAATISV